MPAPALISVALCVYNGERFLPEQLDSVLAQTGVALEVVALDDGSSDGSLALLHAYAARDPRVRVLANPENLGHLRSFERAMSLCQGEFIAPCDQDDIWEPDKLQTLLAAIGTADLAYANSAYVDGDGHATGRTVADETPMMAGGDALPFVFANSVSGHAMLVRRSLLAVAAPFPAGVFHDWWLAMCAAGCGGIRYVDRPLVRFRRHAATSSNMGRRRPTRSAAATDDWLATRGRLLDGLARLGVKDSAGAAALRDALDRALHGGGPGPLLGALWRARAAAPRRCGWPVLDVLPLQLKFWRKLRRVARRGAASAAEPPPR